MDTLAHTHSEKVEFTSIKPQDLVCFTEEYKKALPELKSHLLTQKGKITDIILARIGCGVLTKKSIRGIIKEVTENNFTIIADRDFFGSYDFERDILVHFDNLAGDVPLLLSMGNIDPFDLSGSNFHKFYRELQDARRIMKKGVGVLHSALLTFNLLDRKRYIECEILEVNRSNIEINHIRTLDSKNETFDLAPGTRFIKFVTPESCISGAQINFGIKNKINPYDDED